MSLDRADGMPSRRSPAMSPTIKTDRRLCCSVILHKQRKVDGTKKNSIGQERVAEYDRLDIVRYGELRAGM